MTLKNTTTKPGKGNSSNPTEGDTLLIEKLSLFGLSKNEAIIYLYLLRCGVERGGTKIALATHIHRQYVYVSLGTLIEKGLVMKIEDGARHKYKAVSPNIIEKIARKSVEVASEVYQQLDKISGLDHEQEFQIFMGDQQVKEFERDFIKNLREGETQYIISGASENFLRYFGDEYAKHSATAKEKKLTSYYVGTKAEIDSLNEARRQNPLFNYRLLEGIPAGVTSTVVRMGTVTIYSLARPALVYVIKSKVVSEEYKKYFDVLWNMAQ